MNRGIAFVAVIERGRLEHQVVLLAESIREFAGEYRDAPIWAVQPRPGPAPAPATLQRLLRLGVHFVRARLNQVWSDLGFANKPCAAAFVEGLVEGKVDTLVLLDSDSIVLGPPSDLRLEDGHALAVRPVDRVLLGSPADQALSPYWDRLYRECGVRPEREWTVTATIDQQPIRAYFNGGLLAARPEVGLFRRWNDNMERMARFRGSAETALAPAERWFLDQSSFAATVLASLDRDRVRLLGARYNYPLHLHRELPPEERFGRLHDIVVAHYHGAFYGRRWWAEFQVDEPWATWLRQRLPLPGFRQRMRQRARQLPLLRTAKARYPRITQLLYAARARRQ